MEIKNNTISNCGLIGTFQFDGTKHILVLVDGTIIDARFHTTAAWQKVKSSIPQGLQFVKGFFVIRNGRIKQIIATSWSSAKQNHPNLDKEFFVLQGICVEFRVDNSFCKGIKVFGGNEFSPEFSWIFTPSGIENYSSTLRVGHSYSLSLRRELSLVKVFGVEEYAKNAVAA